MTPLIFIVLSILVLAIVLSITEKIRVDVVALIVLVSLTLTGLITPAEYPGDGTRQLPFY